MNKWIIFLLEKLVVSKGTKFFPHIMESENSKRVHNSAPVFSVLIHIHPIRNLPFKHCSSKWYLNFRLSHHTPVHAPPLTHACHLSIPFLPAYMFISIVFDDDYKSWSFFNAVFCCLQLFPPSKGKIFSSLLCHRMSSACFVLWIWQTRFPHLYKTAFKIIALFFFNVCILREQR